MTTDFASLGDKPGPRSVGRARMDPLFAMWTRPPLGCMDARRMTVQLHTRCHADSIERDDWLLAQRDLESALDLVEQRPETLETLIQVVQERLAKVAHYDEVPESDWASIELVTKALIRAIKAQRRPDDALPWEDKGPHEVQGVPRSSGLSRAKTA